MQLDDILQLAKRCKNATEFSGLHPKAYSFAKRRGWLKKLTYRSQYQFVDGTRRTPNQGWRVPDKLQNFIFSPQELDLPSSDG